MIILPMVKIYNETFIWLKGYVSLFVQNDMKHVQFHALVVNTIEKK